MLRNDSDSTAGHGEIVVPSWCQFSAIQSNLFHQSVKGKNVRRVSPRCACKRSIGCGKSCLNRLVYTECSPENCPCADKCGNRIIQNGQIDCKLEIYETDLKGAGIRTLKPIKAGAFVMEHIGEVVTKKIFEQRSIKKYKNKAHHYGMDIGAGLIIDCHKKSGYGRFVNHSCQPNCGIEKWMVNGWPRMVMYAKVNIAAGEELTYDYNFAVFNSAKGQVCHCMAAQCRGVIGAKPKRVKRTRRRSSASSSSSSPARKQSN